VDSRPARGAASVERFFQFSLLGLVGTGFLALETTHRIDRPTTIITLTALFARAAFISGLARFNIPGRIISALALGYVGFYFADLALISQDFLTATVHGICFLAGLKILTANSARDFAYAGVVAFLELVGAALLSFQATFFVYLVIFVLFAIAALASAEIRRGLRRSPRIEYSARNRIAPRLFAVTCAAALGIMIVTAALFLVLPRTARAAALLFPRAPRLTGYSGIVDLGQFGEIGRDVRPVMHVLPYSGALPPGLKWRGSALSYFDGRRWLEPVTSGEDVPVLHGTAEVAGQLQRSRRDGRRLLYRADIESSDTGTLFIAGIPEYINVAASRLVRSRDDSFRVLPVTGEDLRYEISAHSGPALPEPLHLDERGRYLRLPPIDTRIWSLARNWAGNGDDYERALRIQGHLRRDYTYTLESSLRPLRDPLANFLFVSRRGYCEYFASAMAVMLRTLGIPSRVATGFQSGYFNDVSGMYVVRASDAHVWVEGWFEDRGWVTLDPTPSASERKPDGLSARINMYLDAADSMWRQWVIAYDLGRQAALAADFARSLRSWNRGWAQSNLHPRVDRDSLVRAGKAIWPFVVPVLLLLLAIVYAPRVAQRWRMRALLRRVERSGASAGDAAALYRRLTEMLARRGFERPAWTTPAEFARHLPPDQREPVARFTAAYYAVRFGGDASAASQLVTMLQQFERR